MAFLKFGCYVVLILTCYTGTIYGVCLSETVYQNQCLSPFLDSDDLHGFICSDEGRTVFDCIVEHKTQCDYVNATSDKEFDDLFQQFFYNIDFFCEWNDENSICPQITECQNTLVNYTTTEAQFYGFYDYFCGSKYLLGTFECLASYAGQCPTIVGIYESSVQLTAGDVDISIQTLIDTLQGECSRLTDADVECIQQKEAELKMCGVDLGISATQTIEITCGYTDQSQVCMNTKCEPAVGRFFIQMFSFLNCGQRATACQSVTNEYGTWPVTAVGKTASLPCPTNYDGTYLLSCGDSGWHNTVISTCVITPSIIPDLEDEVDELQNTAPEDIPEKVEGITNTTSEITNDDKFGQSGSNLEKVTEIIEEVVEAIREKNATTTDTVTDQIVETISNLLKLTNEEGWDELGVGDEEKHTDVVVLMEIVEDYNNVLHENLCDNQLTNGDVEETDKDNLYTEVGKRNNADVTFPNKEDAGSTIVITNEALSSKGLLDVCYGGAYYPNIGNFIEGGVYINGSLSEDGREVNSDVISLQIRGLTTNDAIDFDPPIRITLKLKRAGYENAICVFWDFEKNEEDENGAWSSEGCSLVSITNTAAVCECTHLTNFAILMSPTTIPPEHAKVLGIISIVGCGISMVCLVLTIIFYCVVWRLVRSDRAIILMNLCVALLLALAIFLAGVNRTESRAACAAIAALIQYFFLAVFFMMLLTGLEILICVVHVFVTKFRVKVLVPAAWLIPAVIVGVSLGVTKTKGYGNDTFCWLDINSGVIWAFIGPAAFIILVNFIIILVVLKKMASSQVMKSKTTKLQIKTAARSLCVLLPTMGVTWVIGILAVNNDTIALSYMFAILNSLQGLFIFLFHCVFNRHIRDALKQRRARKRSLQTFSSDLRKQSKSQNANELSSSGGRDHTSARRGAYSNSSIDDSSADWERDARRDYHRNVRLAAHS